MYLVTAYRWGWLNNHQYHVYAGPDRDKALAIAQAEAADRGGKYGCTVFRFDETGTSQSVEAHFPSSYGEEAPYHNERIDMFERLGHVLYNYAQGAVSLPDPEKPGALKPVRMEPPEWVVAVVKNAEEFAAAVSAARKG